MLNWLRIENLALIAAIDVEFGPHFNVITGETGAGKSIIMSAVTLLSGSRADKGVIRDGCDRCQVSCSITAPESLKTELEAFCSQTGIAFDSESSELQLRRVITRSGNRNFINDTPVTLDTLRSLSALLIDIHGAAEHQTLLSLPRQLALLDRFAGTCEVELPAYRTVMNDLKKLQIQREELLNQLPDAAECAALQQLLDDLRTIAPEPGEDDAVKKRYDLVANGRQLLEQTSFVRSAINQEEVGLADQLGQVYRALEQLARLDNETGGKLLEQSERVRDELVELDNQVENYSNMIELDEEALFALEKRLSELNLLKRRYNTTLEDLLIQGEQAEAKLRLAGSFGEQQAQLDEREKQLKTYLEAAAKRLRTKREKAAAELTSKAAAKLTGLGFPQGRLEGRFRDRDYTSTGSEEFELFFSANPGQGLQSLRDTASSGELSRLMLALKSVLADADNVPVLIFDEIDMNLGGETANAVAAEMRRLANNRQLLCISHLALIASEADNHFAVRKTVENNETFSSITPVCGSEREVEIARLLGGGHGADEHARMLLKR